MKIRALATLALMATLASCSGIKTTQDFNPDFSFAQVRTWSWMPQPGSIDAENPRGDNQLTIQRIERSVERAMEAKGFQLVESDPDVRVGFHLALNEGVDYQTLNTYWGPGWGYGGMYGPYGYSGMRMGAGMGMGSSTVQQRRYTMGTLIIDVFSEDSHELVWRGSGEGRLREGSTDPQQRQDDSDDAVNQIMDPFPPGN